MSWMLFTLYTILYWSTQRLLVRATEKKSCPKNLVPLRLLVMPIFCDQNSRFIGSPPKKKTLARSNHDIYTEFPITQKTCILNHTRIIILLSVSYWTTYYSHQLPSEGFLQIYIYVYTVSYIIYIHVAKSTLVMITTCGMLKNYQKAHTYTAVAGMDHPK